MRRSERRLRGLIYAAADAFFVHDAAGRILDVNREACESLGYTREELLSLNVADVEQNFSPEEIERNGAKSRRRPPSPSKVSTDAKTEPLSR